jgi:drug/metabolite transporter (DMT)-like permease
MADTLPQRPLRGIALKLGSVMCFIVMAALIKATAGHVPPGEAVFFRSFFAIPVIVIWLIYRRELATGFRAVQPMGHFWRGFVGTLAMGLGFAGLGLLPLPEVTAIGYAAPLLTVIFAAMFLGEDVRAFRITAVALGLVGVMIVLSPRITVLSPDTASQREALGAMLVLFSAVFAALAQVFVRKLVMTEKTPACKRACLAEPALWLGLARPVGGVGSGGGGPLGGRRTDPADVKLP